MLLYHVSEEPRIARFDPRPGRQFRPNRTHGLGHRRSAPAQLPATPRLPRVTFYARPDSHPDDVNRLLGGTTADYVVAIEADWFSRVLCQPLFLYTFSPEPFTMIDEGAGYHIARQSVVPQSVRLTDNLPAELFRRHVELRVMPSLWKLRDAVVASSLQFSMIRMRNAGPRPHMA